MLLQQRPPFLGRGAVSALCLPWALFLDLLVALPHQGPASDGKMPPDSHTSVTREALLPPAWMEAPLLGPAALLALC